MRSLFRCERPKARIPGVSIIQPPPASGSAIALDEVCRPRPVTSLTTPVARAALSTKSLIKVDLPTPEWPTRTEILPWSISLIAAISCGRVSSIEDVVMIFTPSARYSMKKSGIGAEQTLPLGAQQHRGITLQQQADLLASEGPVQRTLLLLQRQLRQAHRLPQVIALPKLAPELVP